MTELWNVWYSELHEGLSGFTVKIDRVVESLQSDFQRIDILETKDFGRLLVLYGSLMAADRDNNAYNEMITHVPLFTHPNPKRALIIGGGDCGALTEILKHPEVQECVMCEIDKMVVEVSKKYFPYLTTGADDPRAKLVFQDGKEYIVNGKDKFDVIMLDLSDPVGPAEELFQEPFYRNVYNRLNDDGILVAQSESPFFNQRSVKGIYANLKAVFPSVHMYTCFMPIYPSAYWSFAFCSKKYHPIKDFDRARWDRLKLKTRYYNADIHTAAFALPEFVKELFR
ncbi:spermidine synthase [candidate division GN15 bacterium]|uniref:Polyamine aminopropyltransferase n=1 Tax=candidate division GN15 bacterium TaxID=2072418 RepID=A0A855X2K6_9BACT|nr:MAG: spermidine synthase [candidate division GN15 bacterium]